MKPFKTKEKRDQLTNYYEFPIGDREHLKISLYYSLGGMSYFTGNKEARGIYLSITPVTIHQNEASDGTVWESEESTLFSGYKHLVKELSRFSKKQLDSCKNYLEFDNPTVKELVAATIGGSSYLNE